jgi:hypothetical protein
MESIRRGMAPHLYAFSTHTGLRSIESELQATACGRYNRISELVGARVPRDATECLNYLNDPVVRMGITVQQMVFQAATGQCVRQ